MRKNRKNILGTVGAMAVAFLPFQNCGQFSSVSQGSLAGGAPLFSNQSTRPNLTSSSAVSGYIFYGQYGVNSNDPMGNKVCEYPSLQNCLTNADGASYGAMGISSSGLSSSSRLHKISFEFQSNGFLSKNPSAHFAMGLRGRITKNASGTPIAVNGRGFIIGTLGADPRNHSNAACASNMLEVESYHGDISLTDPSKPANHVFSDTCTDSIFHESLWYKLELYVSSDRKIAYKVFDPQSNLVAAQVIQDPYDYLDPNLTGFFFGHVFESPITSPDGNWNIIVKNIQTSESESAIEDSFQAPLLNFSLASTRLVDNSLVSFNQIKNMGVFANPFSDVRSRIYGCANPVVRVDSGLSCQAASDFRIINFSGDDSFVKVGSNLGILAAPILNYPADVYKLVLRTNPESTYNQVTIRIDSTLGP